MFLTVLSRRWIFLFGGTKLYCFSILSHFRELLNSLISLSKAGQVPAAFVIARCLYEIGAHS
jgi:hypothetical protein